MNFFQNSHTSAIFETLNQRIDNRKMARIKKVVFQRVRRLLKSSRKPFTSQLSLQRTFEQNFEFKKKRDIIHKKHSSEHRVYESVDDRSLSSVISQNSTDNRINAVKGALYVVDHHLMSFKNYQYSVILKAKCIIYE